MLSMQSVLTLGMDSRILLGRNVAGNVDNAKISQDPMAESYWGMLQATSKVPRKLNQDPKKRDNREGDNQPNPIISTIIYYHSTQ
jgi:hypothetical protein